MKSATNASFPRVEWDFSKVPLEQLEACFAWEYAREWEILRHQDRDKLIPSETIPSSSKDKAKPNPEFEKYMADPDAYVGCIRAKLLLDFQEKLFTPWQDLPKQDKLKFLQHGTPESIGLLELDSPHRDLLQGFELLPNLFGKSQQQKVVFHINWGQSDKRLSMDFAAWLRERRAHPAREQRGRNRRDDLNMLAAMRLLHRMKLEEAIITTTRAVGEPLYGKRPSWERARKAALRIFQEDFLITPNRWQEKQIPLSYNKLEKDSPE